MLVLTLGEPVSTFTWSLKGGEAKEYTPISFYREFLGNDLTNNYVMLMNDPSREFYKCYEIDFDRHRYDGKNWTYVNLPIEDIKKNSHCFHQGQYHDVLFLRCRQVPRQQTWPVRS